MMEVIQDKLTYKTYDDYRDSETDWLGNIPSHWGELANKHIFSLKKSQVGSDSDRYDLLSLTLKGIIKRDMENPEGKFPESFDTYQPVQVGDFVFCLFDVEETPRTVGLSPFDGMITGAYTVMVPKIEIDKKFLYYFFLNLDIKKRMRPLYTGLRNTISKDNFFAFKPYIPPLKEQTAIAHFLDRKTEQIDQAIEIKQKQIELLKERRQILIHKAVTSGLDSDVELKMVELEWIEEIPRHWKLKKGKWLYNEMKRPIREKDEIVTCFRDGQVTLRKNRRTEGFTNSIAEHGYQGIRKGDLVIHNMDAFAGAIGVSDSDGKSTPVYSVCTPKNKNEIDPHYTAHLLRSIAISGYLESLSTGIRQRSTDFRFKDFGNLLLPLPSLKEQIEISDYIKSTKVKFDSVIGYLEAEINSLNELKKTVINNAVTGKIKVS